MTANRKVALALAGATVAALLSTVDIGRADATTGPGDQFRFEVAGHPRPTAAARRAATAGEVTLTAHGTDRAGGVPRFFNAYFINLGTGELLFPELGEGTASLPVPVGRYAVWVGVESAGGRLVPPSLTLMGDPSVDVTGDLTVDFDARQGRPVAITVDRPEARSDRLETVAVRQHTVEHPDWGSEQNLTAAVFGNGDLFVAATEQSADVTFHAGRALLRPEVTLTIGGDVPVRYVSGEASPQFIGDRRLIAVPGDAADVRGKLAVVELNDTGEAVPVVERLAAAGASAVLFSTYDVPDLYDVRLPIPTLYAEGNSGARLLDRLGDGLPARLTGIAASPYAYHVTVSTPGGIPADPTYRLRDRDLATVRAEYSAQAVTGSTGWKSAAVTGIYTMAHRVTLPMTRTEYYSPGEYHHEFRVTKDGSLTGSVHTAQATYGPGESPVERWNVAPFGPQRPANGRQLMFRDGFVNVAVALFTDAVPGHAGPTITIGEGLSGTTVLSRDGVEVVRSDEAGAVSGQAGFVPGTYTLSVRAKRSAPWTTLGTSIAVDWTFPWLDDDPVNVPVLPTARVVVPVDSFGRAARGRVPVTVTADGATGLNLELSYDDGRHWTPVPLKKTGDRWTGWANHPAGAKYVSVRASVRAANGATGHQEVIRSYAVG